MIPATYRPPNLGNLTTLPTRYHKCRPGGSDTFSLSASPFVSIINPQSSTDYLFEDLLIRTVVSESSRTNYNVEAIKLTPLEIPAKSITYESSNTGVLSHPINGVASGVANGEATIISRASDGEVSAKKVTVSITSQASSSTILGSSSNSLNYHCTNQVDSRTAGKDRPSMDIWSVRDHTSQTYQWNTGCWASDITNLNCISPWNSTYINASCGTLISPRHVLFCQHLSFHPTVGATIRFIKPDGGVENFTITNLLAHPYSEGWVTSLHDIVIGKLDRDVPSSIKFAKVLPSNPKPHLPSIKVNDDEYINRFWVRGCYTNQFKRLAVMNLVRLPNVPYPRLIPGQTSGSETNYAHTRWYDYANNQLFDGIIRGDSGSPAFLIINGELVLINVWSGIGTGFAFYTDTTIVNSMMTQLGGGYQLSTVDLSSFPTY